MIQKMIVGLTGFLAIAALVVVVAAPIGPLPGFFLGGEPSEQPFDWEAIADRHEITIRVQDGGLPRVVIIWFANHQGETYLLGAADSGWVQRLQSSGQLQVRVDDATHAYKAERVTDSFAPIRQAFVDKYQTDYPDIIAGYPPVSQMNDMARTFRLTSH